MKTTLPRGAEKQREHLIRINIARYHGFIQDDAKALERCPHHLVRIAR